jgi:hypothetical protein
MPSEIFIVSEGFAGEDYRKLSVLEIVDAAEHRLPHGRERKR